MGPNLGRDLLIIAAILVAFGLLLLIPELFL